MDADRRRINQLALALAGGAALGVARGQTPDPAAGYPSRPIRLIIPFAPGGGTDIIGRAVAQKLTEAWKQPVIVENRAGGNGIMGLDTVAKSTPDGLTLTMITASSSANVTLSGHKQPYDLQRDFAPITQITTQPYVLVVNPAVPAKTVAELIALAKSRAATPMTYGSSGVGGLSHLSGALFAQMAHIPLTHVPYRGGEPAMIDVMSGNIDMLFSTRLQAHSFIAAGKLRALAVTTATRSTASPDIPTMEEAGVPGYQVAGWYGMLAPAATPTAIVDKLNAEIIRIIKLPDVAERMVNDGSEPVGSTPAQFKLHVKTEIERWRKLITELGIPTE